MKKELKDLFSFNSTERNGILVLLTILLFVVIAPGIYSHYLIDKSWKFENAAAGLKALSVESVKNNEMTETSNATTSGKKFALPRLTPFDPNTISEEEWKGLGLKDKQIRTIRNYLTKGGKFRNKEDLKKIYGISKEDYTRLSPFIRVSIDAKIKEVDKENITQKQPFKTKKISLDVNTADSISLLEVRGIGPSFAKRIIKYRELLGGFYSIEQLKEVYGIDSLKYSMLAPQLEVLTPPFRKFKLNNASLTEFRKHPYFDYATAKAIVDRRILKGPFSSPDQLTELMIKQSTILRILPYLEI